MKRITVLLGILGLSLGVFLYRADSVAIVEPFVGTKVASVLLEVKDKARSTNEVVQNKIQDTIGTFVVKTNENQVSVPAQKVQPVASSTPTEDTPQEIVKKPTPLIVSQELTVQGTIAQTNFYRQQKKLSPLTQNSLLTLSAQKKVNDMFAKQYFEHESPSGISTGDLADSVGYVYIMVGENLALGDYESDFELVEGWMNSPGHRENILNPKYTDIGVAVQKGIFEGELVWLAVQEFGRPSSDCPEVSSLLNDQIEASQQLLTELQKKLSDMAEDIENTTPSYGSMYEEKVDTYNELVQQYNMFVEQSKKDVATYNAQVKAHNACVQE